MANTIDIDADTQARCHRNWQRLGRILSDGTIGFVSPLTTKGDILVFSTVNDRLPVGSDGQILSANSAQSTGLQWIAAASVVAFVFSEVPSGTINGSNAMFTLANTPTSGTLRVYKNGLRQKAGSGNDYTLATATITFEAGNVPQTGDILLADYHH